MSPHPPYRSSDVIDHIGIKVSDYQRSKKFYAQVLEALGYRAESSDDQGKSAGFGVKGVIDVWLSEGAPVTRIHLAFRSPDKKTVDKFHAAALAAGGTDNGPPGPRPDLRADVLRGVRARPGRQQPRGCLDLTARPGG